MIEIPKKKKNLKQEFENIFSLIMGLQKRIELLEKTTKNYEKKNEELEINNKKLEDKNKQLEKKIENLENKIEKLENKENYKKNIFQSNIIDKENEKIIINWIPKIIKSAELIFDTYIDGDTIDDFINKCHGKSPTLIIIRTETGIIFGGYATSPWKENEIIEDNSSFIFSLNPPIKYKLLKPKFALFGYNKNNNIMFQFGCCDFIIVNNCSKNSQNYIYSSHSCYESGFENLFNGISDKRYFKVNRLEIFKLNY